MDYLITYGTDGSDGTIDYRPEQQEVINQTIRFADVDGERFRWTSDRMKKTEFWSIYKRLLSNPTPFGYFIWKPFIVLNALQNMNNNEVVLYFDVDLQVRQNPQWLIDLADEHGIGAQDSSFENCAWTRRDCFVVMGCDEEKYWYARQVWAATLAFKKTSQVMEIVTDWLLWCLQEDAILGRFPNKYGKEDFGGGVDHRHEQSILTNLMIKNGIYIERDKGEWGFGHPPFPKGS